MHLEIVYRPDFQTTLKGQRIFKRPMRFILFTLGAIYCAVGIYNVSVKPHDLYAWVPTFLYALLMALLPEVLIRWFIFRQRKLLNRDVAITLTDQTIELTADDASHKLAWSAFTKITRRRGYWIFKMTPVQALILPETMLTAEGNAELSTFLEAGGRLKARGRKG